MKRLLLLISLAITFLSGCSTSVPDCGDAKTTSMVNDLVLQSLLGEDAKNLSDMFKVEISAVQTIAHSKDPEKYSCKANVKITTAGKLNELFGHTGEQVALIRNKKLPADEAKNLGHYADFANHLNSKYKYDSKSAAMFGDIDADFETLVAIKSFFKPDMKDFFAVDADTARASAATMIMLTTPRAIARSTGEKAIEFVSTSAQQNGANLHYVEIQKTSAKPDTLLIEMAKFAKTYTPTTPSKITQSTLSESPAISNSASAPTENTNKPDETPSN